jgi:hypothetical protein
VCSKNDSIEGIYDSLKECAVISKSAGGIGISIHNIRATGSYIRGTNGTSNGIVPMLRVFNDTARYVDQVRCCLAKVLSALICVSRCVLCVWWCGGPGALLVGCCCFCAMCIVLHAVLAVLCCVLLCALLCLLVCLPPSSYTVPACCCCNNSCVITGSAANPNTLAAAPGSLSCSLSQPLKGGGKRKGAFAVYLEPWHADIFEWLDMRKNHGKEEARARDLFYGLWINDLFMQRVEANQDWSLFCPNEAPGLAEVWGEDFEKLYTR